MGSLPALTWTDLADIAVVSLLAWGGIVSLRRSRARPALAGLAILGAVYLLARRLGLQLTASILQGFFAVLVLVLVVVFQDELRRIFERLGAMGLRRRPRAPADGALEAVARTAGQLVERRLGGLMVLPGHDPLERLLEGGIALDGSVSEPLLVSLFDPHSPGHDGAVVVRGDRVDRFSMLLPLSSNRAVLGLRGTRHAAALGLAERTDALVVVVSEELATISVALDGDLRTIADSAALAAELHRFIERVSPRGPVGRRSWRALGVRWHEVVLAVAIGVLGWLFNASALDPTETVRAAPVAVERVPAGYQVEDVEPAEVRVTLSGPRRQIVFGGAGDLRVRLDADLVRLGRRTFQIGPADVEVPDGLEAVGVEPDRVRLTVREPGG
jgi:uncharacterized protein (TIGR00159 family)